MRLSAFARNVATLATAVLLLAPIRLSAQDSLSFSSFSIESGIDLTKGVVYRFHDVKVGFDALVRLDSLRGGATLAQIDDASPSTPVLSPRVSGVPSNSPDPQVDFTITFVEADTSTPVALDSLDMASVDIDGGAARKEFTVLRGFDSYRVEGNPPTLLTVTEIPDGTRFDAPEQDYGGSSPDTTEVAVVGQYTGVSQVSFSLGQTGTGTGAATRVSALFFMPSIVPYVEPDTTTTPDGKVGSAMQIGTPNDNGNGTFTIPVVVTVVGYGTTSLYDLVVTGDLSGLGTYAASPTEGEYSVDDPVIASTSGGAVVAASSANAAYNGGFDKRVVKIVAGNVLPPGASVSVTYNILWYPPTGVDQSIVHVMALADHAEDLTSAGATSDLSHTGTDPDPDADGPGNNFAGTSIDLGTLPVELADFSATENGASVLVRWATLSEQNVAGFEVENRAAGDAAFVGVGYVEALGDSFAPKSYSFSAPVNGPGTYEFRLRMIDLDASFTYGPVVEVAIGLDSPFVLGAAYPNPTTGAATIPVALRNSGDVELSVFDLTGRRVAVLVSGTLESGARNVEVEAGRLPAGTYVYRLQTRDGAASRLVTILR